MSFFRRVAPLVLLVVLGLAGLHACSGEEVTHSGVASFRSDIAPAEQSQRQLLLVSEDSTEPPHEVTVTKLEDGSYDVLLKWVLDRTLTGFRILFSGSENFETSNVEVLSVEYASAVMETMFNPTGTEMLSPHALMDVDGGAITSYRGPILLGNMPGNDAPTLVKSPFVLTIPCENPVPENTACITPFEINAFRFHIAPTATGELYVAQTLFRQSLPANALFKK